MLLLPSTRYKGCRKSTGFDGSPRYVKFDQNLAPLLEVKEVEAATAVIVAQVSLNALAGRRRLRLPGRPDPAKKNKRKQNRFTKWYMFPLVVETSP